jgi:hypothetical protein
MSARASWRILSRRTSVLIAFNREPAIRLLVLGYVDPFSYWLYFISWSFNWSYAVILLKLLLLLIFSLVVIALLLIYVDCFVLRLGSRFRCSSSDERSSGKQTLAFCLFRSQDWSTTEWLSELQTTQLQEERVCKLLQA